MDAVGERDAVSNWSETVRISELDTNYWHKIVDGPRKVWSVFYPSVNADGKQNKYVLTVKDFDANPFSIIAKIDKEIQKREILDRLGNTEQAKDALSKVRSSLDPGASYHCLILDKKDDVPIVKHAEYRKTLYEFIVKAEAERYVDDLGNKNEAMLRYGLLFMIWFEFNRVEQNRSADKRFNVAYTGKVLEKFVGDWAGKVPAVYLNKPISVNRDTDNFMLDLGTKTVSIPVVKYGMLTKLEFDAIVNYEFSLKQIVQPMTPDEILDKTNQYPLRLDAVDEKGRFLLPEWERIKEELHKKNLSLPVYAGESRQLPAHSRADIELEDEPEILRDEPKKEKPQAKQEKVVEEDDELAEIFSQRAEKEKEEAPKKRGRKPKEDLDKIDDFLNNDTEISFNV